MTLLNNVSLGWSLQLNWCVAASASESLEALEALESNVLFLFDTILLKLEGGIYIRLIIPGALLDFTAGGSTCGNIRGSGRVKGGGCKGG